MLDFGYDINILIYAVGMIVFMVMNLMKNIKINALKIRNTELEALLELAKHTELFALKKRIEELEEIDND